MTETLNYNSLVV